MCLPGPGERDPMDVLVCLKGRAMKTTLLRGANATYWACLPSGLRMWLQPVGMSSFWLHFRHSKSCMPSLAQSLEHSTMRAVQLSLSLLHLHQRHPSVHDTPSQQAFWWPAPSSAAFLPTLMSEHKPSFLSVLCSSTTFDIIHIFHFKYL